MAVTAAVVKEAATPPLPLQQLLQKLLQLLVALAPVAVKTPAGVVAVATVVVPTGLLERVVSVLVVVVVVGVVVVAAAAKVVVACCSRAQRRW